MYIYIYTHKIFFYAIRKFYFVIRRRRETIIVQNGDPALRAARVIAVCNKQLPMHLAISMAGRPHSRRALALSSRAYLRQFLIINNSLTIAKIVKWYKTFCSLWLLSCSQLRFLSHLMDIL